LLATALLSQLVQAGRVIKDARELKGDPPAQRNLLGVLAELPGKWSNTEGFEGHAWNMIALPFGKPGALGDFRLLLNQANETLDFDLVDFGVPNRGADRQDQHLAAVRYLQALNQVAATDASSDPDGSVREPATQDTNDTPKGIFLHPTPADQRANLPVGIHREPGLFLHLASFTDLAAGRPGPDLARLANIPHGDAVLAMGFGGDAKPTPGAPDLTNTALRTAFDPLPIGLGSTDLGNPYLGPYKHFHDHLFENLFDPTDPLKLLNGAIPLVKKGAKVIETTIFTVDSQVQGGIQNIPFVIRQANAVRVTATFWIQKVQPSDGGVLFVLQYAQRVLLEFFPRADGKPGLIQWPHISINTMIREP
jgi:hypothetical protein